MKKDKLAGAGILLVSIAVGIVYALLLYLGYGSTLAIIFVSAAFFVLLGIVGWIGWIMATAPSPKPFEGEIGSAESTKEKRAKKSRGKRRSPK